MLSKSLCRFQHHGFGLVSTNRYFHDFHTSDFCSQTSETLYLQAYCYTYLFTLDINTIVSTWLDWIFLITTIAHFQPIGSVDTVDKICLFGRYSRQIEIYRFCSMIIFSNSLQALFHLYSHQFALLKLQNLVSNKN